MKKFNDYYMGLDIGTNSVGWAVTDLDYQLLRMNGKSFWGSRLFPEAQTAEERRLHRCEKRRNLRKKQRIQLLKELFAKEISKEDPSFYQRLQESQLILSDKTKKEKNILFCDENYTDQDFYRDYPTIYHLRKAWIDDQAKKDIRLLYLAIEHIIKNRGHFLFENQDLKGIASFNNAYSALRETLENELEIKLNETPKTIQEIEDILLEKELSKQDRKKKLNKVLDASTKQEKAIVTLICGGKASLSDLFDDSSLKEEANNSISFQDANYEDFKDTLQEVLAEKFIVIEKIKVIYDWSVLKKIMNSEDYRYLSEAKIAIYEKHKKDLQILKKVVKKYFNKSTYDDIFSKDIKNNYAAYVGHPSRKTKVLEKKCTQEDFGKFVKGKIEKIHKNIDIEDRDVSYILEEINNKNFMPKQVQRENGVIPYQLHLEELKLILENASQYFSFLNQIDETKKTVKEKILSIMTFRIPYYVGPLNNHSQYAWVVRLSHQKIYPWNFDEVIDKKASAEDFIKRMTNMCSYLIGEDVLPKNSLLYSEFLVLNELNNLKINGEYLSVKIKQDIFEQLYKKYKTVKIKRIKNYLIHNGIMTEDDNIEGFDLELKASYKVYLDFEKIVGKHVNNTQMIEDLIRWITIFNESKDILKDKIKEVYGDQLTKDQINKISKLNYTGWGRFSKRLLTDVYDTNQETGEMMNIIEALRTTQDNFMQLMRNDKGYVQAIDAINATLKENETAKNMIENLYLSPAIKRSVWQTLKIVNEIRHITGHDPKKLFIETTRSHQEKKRTKSRKDRLLELYKKCKTESRDWIKEIEGKDESLFKRDVLFLYYTQMGKCMYTGKTIHLEDLKNSNIYDVDHILPQSKTKDDGIDNRVLVLKSENSAKGDDFPIKKEIQKKQKKFWDHLLKKQLISKKKYDRLMRTTTLTTDELASFISRQLVETSQSTKAIASVMKQQLKETEIVYVKARNVSEFRYHRDNKNYTNEDQFVKVREVNDFHHAKDAYLNIVVGNVFNTKFTHSPQNYIKNLKKQPNEKYSLNRMYNFNIKGAWKRGNNGTIQTVRDVMSRDDCLYSRYTTEAKGTLFDVTLMKAGNGQSPIKAQKDNPLSNIERYGGYNKVKGAYFCLVESSKKGQRIRTIEFVSIMKKEFFEASEENKLNYCKNTLKLEEPKILIAKIKMGTLLKVDGFLMYLQARQNDSLVFDNAVELKLDQENYNALKLVVKVYAQIMEYKKLKKVYEITEYDKITLEKTSSLYDQFMDKLLHSIYGKRLSKQGEQLKEKRENFLTLTLADQCITLIEILHFFQCNGVMSNLQSIGGKSKVGRLTLNKNISKNKEVKIIHKSVTGIFEQEVDLLSPCLGE